MSVKISTLKSMPSACEVCGKTHEDGFMVDLRPYGENGQWICFDCGMSPKLRPIVDKTFNQILNNNDIIIR